MPLHVTGEYKYLNQCKLSYKAFLTLLELLYYIVPPICKPVKEKGAAPPMLKTLQLYQKVSKPHHSIFFTSPRMRGGRFSAVSVLYFLPLRRRSCSCAALSFVGACTVLSGGAAVRYISPLRCSSLSTCTVTLQSCLGTGCHGFAGFTV